MYRVSISSTTSEGAQVEVFIIFFDSFGGGTCTGFHYLPQLRWWPMYRFALSSSTVSEGAHVQGFIIFQSIRGGTGTGFY